jgi:hypothetical protein
MYTEGLYYKIIVFWLQPISEASKLECLHCVSLIYVNKARSLSFEWSTVSYTTLVGSSLAFKINV